MTPAWVCRRGRSALRKVKVEETVDFIVIGIAGPSAATFGRPELVLATCDAEGRLRYAGKLTSPRSYDSKRKRVKGTKTGVVHVMPVHPTLATVLAMWKATGWPTRMGRAPEPDDLIIPTINETHRDVRKALEEFHEDLERLGLRKRRHYDPRRTFIPSVSAAGLRRPS